jgi:hypothetical protein
MAEQPQTQGGATTLPPPSVNGASGTARITQLRRIMRRDRREPSAS